jgi:hypothetical protein
MRLMFVYWPYENAGSAVDLFNYSQAARSLGHEVVVYGPKDARLCFDCSLDVRAADAVVFVLEWNLYLHHGGWLNLVRLLAEAPRERRVVIDCDAMYNDAISIGGDCNHPDVAASRRRVALCDALSDRICQPTLHPLRRNVRSFLFHGYNPAWEVPLDCQAKEYGLIYVGNNWFRWRSLARLLHALEPVRHRLGRMALVGKGWSGPVPHDPRLPDDAYDTDPACLEKWGVEVLPPVHFRDVVGWMSKGIVNPVIYRPLFAHLKFVTCRTFETPAADTIPLFDLSAGFVREIYGEEAVELVLHDRPAEKVLDVLRRPEHYAEVVQGVRRHLRARHSYEARLRQLLEIVHSAGGSPPRRELAPGTE